MVVLASGCSGAADHKPPATSSSSPIISSIVVTSLSPVPRIFDEAALQDGVRRVLVQAYGLGDVGTVRCPSGQAVQAGISFDCAVQVGGVGKHVTLTVRGADGTYEVSQPK